MSGITRNVNDVNRLCNCAAIPQEAEGGGRKRDAVHKKAADATKSFVFGIPLTTPASSDERAIRAEHSQVTDRFASIRSTLSTLRALAASSRASSTINCHCRCICTSFSMFLFNLTIANSRRA